MRNWIKSETDKLDIILLSRVSLSRNIKDNKFIRMLNEDKARSIVENVCDTLNDYDEFKELSVIKSWESNEYDLKGCVDKQIAGKSFIDKKGKSAVAFNNDESLIVSINEEDHIKIQGITAGFDLDECYVEVDKLDNYIGDKLSYEFNNEYGYLTSSMSNLGTGMRASIIMHLPMLSINKKIDGIKEEIKGDIIIKPVFNEGRLYEISNNITLGIKEEDILQDVKKYAADIIKSEKGCRELLMSSDIARLEDKVFRALGILRNARIITGKESLELLSNVRLGIEMSILDINKSVINKALIDSRDSIIQGNLKEILTKERLDHIRAEIIRKILC